MPGRGSSSGPWLALGHATTQPTTAFKGSRDRVRTRSSSRWHGPMPQPMEQGEVEAAEMKPLMTGWLAEAIARNPASEEEEIGQLDQAVRVFLSVRPRLFRIAYGILRNRS